MPSNRLKRRMLTLLTCLVCLLMPTSCALKLDRFGIIFTSDNRTTGAIDIYRIYDNTQSKVEQLTFTPMIGEYGLLVSKNGSRIVFSTGFYSGLEMEPSESAIEELRHVYLLDTTSKKLIDITNVLEDKYAQIDPDFSMDWSPDSKQFMTITHEGEGYEIKNFLEFVDFDGKNRKDILIPTTGEIPALFQTAKWSPNLEKIVLTQGVIGVKEQLKNPGSAILIYDMDSRELIQLTDYEDGCLPREWSPTSQQIVTTCSYSPPYNTKGVSGPETVRILDIERLDQPFEQIFFNNCYDPSWSPDGSQIVFVCNKDSDQAELFVVNSDGSEIYEVKLGSPINTEILKDPTWSPDGKQIVYVSGSDFEHTNIYSVYLDGYDNYPLTEQEAVYNIVSVYPTP